MIFLDAASGTKPYPEVIDVITDVLTNNWGNASADYSWGKDAQAIIDSVTEQISNDINCKPEEIIWTSGACEANSLAILGIAQKYYTQLYVSKLEHTSINKIADNFESLDEGNYCNFIDNDKTGFISLQDLKQKLTSNKYINSHVTLASISFANSEIGTIQDIKSIAQIVHQHNGILHVDATQMYPWSKIDVQELGIDMMSVSGQKLHAVKGVGFLYVKEGIELSPLIYGSQQDSRRGGTYPTHLIAAFGKALEITRKNNASEKVCNLRGKLMDALQHIPGVTFNGPLSTLTWRLPNIISMTVDGVDASQLVAMCDEQGIMIAKGSACQSYNPVPSKTLIAIGLTKEQALSTIRISLDEFNTEEEIKYVADILPKIIKRLREVS